MAYIYIKDERGLHTWLKQHAASVKASMEEQAAIAIERYRGWVLSEAGTATTEQSAQKDPERLLRTVRNSTIPETDRRIEQLRTVLASGHQTAIRAITSNLDAFVELASGSDTSNQAGSPDPNAEAGHEQSNRANGSRSEARNEIERAREALRRNARHPKGRTGSDQG